MSYAPTPGPLPGVQYRPSNSDEGYGFIGAWCCDCARDRSLRDGVELDDCDDDEKCEIVAASFRGEAVEWRRAPGRGVFCIAFIPAGQPVPPPRCAHTLDLFASNGTTAPQGAHP